MIMRNIEVKTVFREFEGEYFTGITLGKNDIVKVGVYSRHRMKVSTILNRYGKKGVLNLLINYDLEEEILEEYHIHKLTPEEKEMREKLEQMNKVQEDTNVSVTVGDTFETTTTQDVDEEYPDRKNMMRGTTGTILWYNPKDESWYGGPWKCRNNNRLYTHIQDKYL